MKIAYCIICHKNSNVLKASIEELSKNNDVFLHVDKKSDIRDFDEYKEKITFMSKRYDVRWGDFSQVKCMLEFIKFVVEKKYDYMCLLSGDDLPIKPADKIMKFFALHNKYEFIGIQNSFNNKELVNRIKRVHNNWYFKKNKNKIEKLIIKIQEKFNLFKVNQLYDELPKLYKGPQWFCITNELCNYILNYLKENPWYVQAFEKSYCSDEIFFQTIVANSKFKENIYKFNEYKDDNRMALRYIDWITGPEYPKMLDENDLNKINNKSEDIMFARKFKDDMDIEKYKQKLLM